MAVQENTNVSTDFAKAQSIDFVNQFTDGIKKLQEMLGITRRQALSEGSTIKTYMSKVTLADGNVAEGDLVPLSKVEKIPDKTYELAFRKSRRAAPCCGEFRATSALILRPSWQPEPAHPLAKPCRLLWQMRGDNCRSCSKMTMQGLWWFWQTRWTFLLIWAAPALPHRTHSA